MVQIGAGSTLGTTIQTGEIDNLAVTEAKLAADAVSFSKLGPAVRCLTVGSWQ